MDGGEWISRGSYTFDTTAQVVFRTTGTNGYVIADGVKFAPQDNNEDVQAGDGVVIAFDQATNGYEITAENMDTVLALNNNHTWGSTTTAEWGDNYQVLTITFGTGFHSVTGLHNVEGLHNVDPGDMITIGSGTITGYWDDETADGSPPPITGLTSMPPVSSSSQLD